MLILQMQAAIRQMTQECMGRKTARSPFDLARLPDSEEITEFEEASEDAGPCCSVDNFRPDLNGTARSKWNVSTAEVFVEAYMNEGAFPCEDAKLVEKYFVRHLRYLINTFKERHNNEDVLEARAKAKRRRERRTYVSLFLMSLLTC